MIIPTPARRWFCLTYWLVLIVLNHLPPSTLPHLPGRWTDKAVHFSLFLLLSLLIGWAWDMKKFRSIIGLGLGLLIYAAADELTQAWTGRTPDFYDWLSDAAGLECGLMIYIICLRAETGKSSKPDSPKTSCFT